MFTGLIQDIGTVEQIDASPDGARFRIATSLGAELAEGDSIAVDGVCLTATAVDAEGFEAEVMNQTQAVTASAMLRAGDRVNLELAMRPSDRLGGHIVQGHVDDVGEVSNLIPDGFSRGLRIRLGPSSMRYVVPKGSIALDGVSLTVAELSDDWVGVSLIPETLERTTLGEAKVGTKLNVECDVIAKHVERLMAPFAGKERA